MAVPRETEELGVSNKYSFNILIVALIDGKRLNFFCILVACGANNLFTEIRAEMYIKYIVLALFICLNY